MVLPCFTSYDIVSLMKKYLITSALPYINGIKHLGNLVGSLLPADIYARYLRQRGEQVLCICGTDDHGAPAEIAAQEAGMPVAEYCRNMYQVQKDIYAMACVIGGVTFFLLLSTILCE